MAIFVLKLVLTPALIAVASLVGRRWGPAVGGWLVGLPLTSAPVALFVALDHGTRFASAAAAGSLVGAAAEAGFCLGYVTGSARGRITAVACGGLGFVVAGLILLPAAGLPLGALLLVAIAALAATLRLIPGTDRDRRAVAPPSWDLPARMAVGAAIVLLVTAVAPVVGPQLAGIAAAFPVFAIVLALFAHGVEGRPSAIEVLRGLLVGLFAFTAFFAVVAATIEALGTASAFGLAIVAAVAVQGVSLRLVRPSPSSLSAGPAVSVPPTSGTAGF